MVPKTLTNQLGSNLMGGTGYPPQSPVHHSILGGAIPSTGQFYPTPANSLWPVDADSTYLGKKKRFKLSKFEEVKRKLRRKSEPQQGIDWYYEHHTCEEVIEVLGWWNPIYGGRPKKFVQMLLDGIPSPVAGKGMHWKGLGLMYFTPPVVGRSRSKNRTSVAGLALLKHWASQYPGFKKFLDAYHDPKMETQITLDCIDLALGTFPARFKKITDDNVGRIERQNTLKKERYAHAMQMARQAQGSLNQQAQGLYPSYQAAAVRRWWRQWSVIMHGAGAVRQPAG